MQMPVKICLIARAERGLRQFFFSNFPFSRRAIWHIFNQSSGIRSNKELYRVFLCVYVSHIWKFCRVAGWIFLIREKALRFVYLGETFRPYAEPDNNVAIHPYFHVLCVISLSVSYGGALFTGTKSFANPTVSHNRLLTAVRYYRSRPISKIWLI